MYKGVFKNNQVTYGNPFKINTPMDLYKFAETVSEPVDEEDDENEEDFLDSSLEPEEILERAKKQYDSIIEKAQREAEEIIEQAKIDAAKEADSISEEAWSKGYADGIEAAKEQNEAILAEAEQIRNSAAEEHDKILSELEKEIVELTMTVARKVVASELTTNREIIVKLVEEALATCSNKENAVVRVSAEDGKYLEENTEEFMSSIGGADDIQLKCDSSLSPGDCILETSFGSIDAGANTKINKIEEAFKDQVASQ